MKKVLTAICLLSACQATFPVSEPPHASSLAAEQTPTPSVSVDPGPDHLNTNTLPGALSVIYKNNYKVRIQAERKSVTSDDLSCQQAVNQLLQTHKVISMTDASYGMSEEEAAASQALITEKSGEKFYTEVPNRFSMHSYQFPTQTNTGAISGSLSALSCVQSAYLTPSFQTGALQAR